MFGPGLLCNDRADQDGLICPVRDELICSVSGSKVLNNPLESAFIAVEQIEVLIYYACDTLIISQLFIALRASLIHHFGLHSLRIL